MKRILVLVAFFALVSISCTTSKIVKGDKEKKFVSTFLGYMDHKNEPNHKNMLVFIAPSFIKANNINTSDCKVNNYSFYGFNIESFNATSGIVITKIWGENKSWIHELDFKVMKEKGKLYLMPSKYDENYIDPWISIKTYTKE